MVEVRRLLSLVLNHCSPHSLFSWCWTLVTLHTLSCCRGFFCIFVFKMDEEERYMTYYLRENRTEPCITKYRLFHKLLIVFSFIWHSPLLPRICLYCLKKWTNVPQVHKCTGSPRFPKSQSVATHPTPPHRAAPYSLTDIWKFHPESLKAKALPSLPDASVCVVCGCIINQPQTKGPKTKEYYIAVPVGQEFGTSWAEKFWLSQWLGWT